MQHIYYSALPIHIHSSLFFLICKAAFGHLRAKAIHLLVTSLVQDTHTQETKFTTGYSVINS